MGRLHSNGGSENDWVGVGLSRSVQSAVSFYAADFTLPLRPVPTHLVVFARYGDIRHILQLIDMVTFFLDFSNIVHKRSALRSVIS